MFIFFKGWKKNVSFFLVWIFLDLSQNFKVYLNMSVCHYLLFTVMSWRTHSSFMLVVQTDGSSGDLTWVESCLSPIICSTFWNNSSSHQFLMQCHGNRTGLTGQVSRLELTAVGKYPAHKRVSHGGAHFLYNPSLPPPPSSPISPFTWGVCSVRTITPSPDRIFFFFYLL